MQLNATAARDCVENEYGDVVTAVGVCADTVAASWGGDATEDASAVGDRLEACLAERGVLDALPGVLADAVNAAGGTMQASPVAAPPYVVVTSRGPVLRATLDGGRLVVTVAVFRVTDDRRYERADGGVDVRASWTGTRA